MMNKYNTYTCTYIYNMCLINIDNEYISSTYCVIINSDDINIPVKRLFYFISLHDLSLVKMTYHLLQSF